MESVEERNKKIVEILDKKIAELTEEMNVLKPQVNQYKILTHQISILQKACNEFRGHDSKA